MDNITLVAQALCDETRVRILHLLMVRECCVCEIMHALDIPQAKVSRHIRMLSKTGFIRARADGVYSLYSMSELSAESFQTDLLTAVRRWFKTSPLAQQDVLRLNQSIRLIPGRPTQEQQSCECLACRRCLP